jgi:hypothetical protein
MRKSAGTYFFLILLLLFLFCFEAAADTKVVGGFMEFRFELSSGDQEILDSFFEYENNSNSQRVVERAPGRIVVETRADIGPFKSEVSFPVGKRYRSGDFSAELEMSTSRSGVRIERRGSVETRTELVEKTPMSRGEMQFLRKRAEEAAEGAETQAEAVERIMRSIRKHVSYRLGTSSNPVDVLKSGRAYCEGYANAGALMIRSLGIPAKVIDSYIPPGHMWGFGQEGSGGFHAHVEVYYQDAGWVSYDPQATVHYVDPFHIVRYPRRRVRLRQLSQKDERHILDRIGEPDNWDNFYQRKSYTGRRSPLLVGTIYKKDGSRAADSFRSKEWVYRRVNGGEGEGIRILSNGSFAVSPKEGEDSVDFFYRDGEGGWLEYRVSFDGPEKKEQTFRLDEPEKLHHLELGRGKNLYVWFKDRNDRWKIDSVRAGDEGRVSILSDEKSWVVSGSRNLSAPLYLLDTAKLQRGKSYTVSDLPRYYDPGTVYVSGALSPMNGPNARIRMLRRDGARTEEFLPDEDGTFVLPLPGPEFSLLMVSGDAMLLLRRIEEAAGKNTGADTAGADTVNAGPAFPTFPDVADGLRRVRVETSSPGTRVYLVKKQGSRYKEYGRTTADAQGRALLFVDGELLEEQELFVLFGSPSIRGRLPLRAAEEGVLRFR